MESGFYVFTSFDELENMEEVNKGIYVYHKGKVVCWKLFKEIKNIRKFLEEIHGKVLKETPYLKIEGKLNFLYFKWLEECSR